jgi:hypothetical protein
MIPLALAVTVLISSWVIRVKTMWCQAPITAAIVIAAGISRSSTLGGLQPKRAEVILAGRVSCGQSWRSWARTA